MWLDDLKKASDSLCQGDYPEWWDGFHNVLVRGETSGSTDNPYMPDDEGFAYHAYRAGACAAESLIKHMGR